jgi:CII-binding regulator of phage lambda lysogenization HflD
MQPSTGPQEDSSLPIPSLEGLSDDEAIPVVIAELEKIDNRDEPAIYGMHEDGISTVNQLIDAIRNKTPQGLEMLALYRDSVSRMQELDGKRKSQPSFLQGISDKLRGALRKVTGGERVKYFVSGIE